MFKFVSLRRLSPRKMGFNGIRCTMQRRLTPFRQMKHITDVVVYVYALEICLRLVFYYSERVGRWKWFTDCVKK